MTTSARKVLDVGLYHNSLDRSAVCCIGAKSYQREVYTLCTENTWLTLLRSFFLRRRLSKYEIIITHEYFSSFGVNLRLLVTFCRTKHVTVGLNQSRKLLRTEFQTIDRQINRIFQRCNLIIVHSRREMKLFSEIHSMPLDRFYFSLWGFDLPNVAPGKFFGWERPYVCLVGRNNRDVGTFIKALEGMPIDGILITSNHQTVPKGLPGNIHVFRELPLLDTLDCIINARINLILLKDNDRGAGHITTVAAMFAGTPQIFSDVEVIRDYLVDGVSAIGVPISDDSALKAAIERLLRDSTLGSALSKNAKTYAERWLDHKAASDRVALAIDSLWQGTEVSNVDPRWLQAFELFSARRVRSGEQKTIERSSGARTSD
jgi:glycosyltransferase involved in cell wall biosynthesis